MARVTNTIVPTADFPTGEQTVGPASIPNNVSVIRVEIARCTAADLTIWPDPATTINLLADIAIGNGPFVFVAGAGASGGRAYDRQGADAPATWLEVAVPPGTNRKIQVRTTITNGPLRTNIAVSTE